MEQSHTHTNGFASLQRRGMWVLLGTATGAPVTVRALIATSLKLCHNKFWSVFGCIGIDFASKY